MQNQQPKKSSAEKLNRGAAKPSSAENAKPWETTAPDARKDPAPEAKKSPKATTPHAARPNRATDELPVNPDILCPGNPNTPYGDKGH